MDNLSIAIKGKDYKVKGFGNNLALPIKRRLLDLGFTTGQEVKLLRKSLLGKAYLIEIRDFVLTLRSDIVSQILVEKRGEL